MWLSSHHPTTIPRLFCCLYNYIFMIFFGIDGIQLFDSLDLFWVSYVVSILFRDRLRCITLIHRALTQFYFSQIQWEWAGAVCGCWRKSSNPFHFSADNSFISSLNKCTEQATEMLSVFKLTAFGALLFSVRNITVSHPSAASVSCIFSWVPRRTAAIVFICPT